MNMSEDVSQAVINVSTQIAVSSIDTISKNIDRAINDIAKLIAWLIKNKMQSSVQKDISYTSLNDIKPGETSVKDLITNARKNNQSISTSEQCISNQDKKTLIAKAKEYGIPIAFTGSDDASYPHVRSSDLPIYKQICTEMIKEKIAVKPQELGNFKCKAWEIKHIQNECSKYNIPVSFAQTKDNQFLGVYEKADEKAVMIALNQYRQNLNDVKDNIIFERDENDMFTIKKSSSDEKISFEHSEIPDSEELSELIQEEFGFDKNKADLLCARFGEEHLQGDEKINFFQEDIQNKFSDIKTNITFTDENIYTQKYTCLQIVPRTIEKPYIVYQASDGKYAVLSSRMSKSHMQKTLSEQLHISDQAEINALIEKVGKVTEGLAREAKDNFEFKKQFNKNDFDMSDLNVTANMKRTAENGEIYTKSLPVDKIDVKIERTKKNKFKITSKSTSIEIDSQKNFNTLEKMENNIFSFSDKKKTINELSDMFIKQGILESVAKLMAKIIYEKAKKQTLEKTLLVEEIRMKSDKKFEFDVSLGSKTKTISSENMKDDVITKLGVPSEVADDICNSLEEKLAATDRQLEKLQQFGFKNVDNWKRSEASDMIKAIQKNHWQIPKGINPETYVPKSLATNPVKKAHAIGVGKR